jgi:hypothetical protein
MTMPFKKPLWGRGIFCCAPSNLHSSANAGRAFHHQQQQQQRQIVTHMTTLCGYDNSWLLCNAEQASCLSLCTVVTLHAAALHTCCTPAANIALYERLSACCNSARCSARCSQALQNLGKINSPVALILFMPHMLLQLVALHSSGMPALT